MKPEPRKVSAGAGHEGLLCPSAQPEMAGSVVLGVMGGTVDDPRLSYLDEPLPVTEELLGLAGPVRPTEVFRFAARCEETACCHFDGKNCGLVTRIVQILPAVVDALPPCKLRAACRWFQQEGGASCLRCPQIITFHSNPSADMTRAATPA